MKTKIFLLFLFAIPLMAQSNKIIRESDLKAYYDSTGSGGGGTNLEPELVVTPGSSKIVMDVDSVRINGKLTLSGYTLPVSDGTVNQYMVTDGAGNVTWSTAPFSLVDDVGVSIKTIQVSGGSVPGSADFYTNWHSIVIGETNETNIETGETFDADDRNWMYNHRAINGAFFGVYMLGGLRVDGEAYFAANLQVEGYLTVNDYTLPPVDGSAGTVMKTDGDGNLYWGSDIYGGGTGGVGHADSLTHLGRVIPGDSVVTYADGFTRYEPKGVTISEVSLLQDSLTQKANKTWFSIPPAVIDDSIRARANTAWFSIPPSKIDDSITVKLNRSETSAWDKNSSNDRLLADTTGSGGNTATRYQLLKAFGGSKVNLADTTTYGAGQYETRYHAEKTYIKDGNTNWNNEYGYITGISANYITEPMLKAVNAPTDEMVLTYESTIGDFEWQSTAGDTSDYTITEIDSLLNIVHTNDATWTAKQTTITNIADTAKYLEKSDSTLYATQYDLTQLDLDGITNIVDDTTPQLGGDLDLNDKSLVNTSPTFTVTATEVSYIDGLASNAQVQINALEDSIQALNSKFQSILDALTGCCDLSDVTPPSAPTSLVATADNDTAKIRLTWTDPTAGDLDSIRIYRAVVADTSAYTYLARVAAGVKAYTNTGLTENTAYWYKLKAVDDSSNVSGYSNRDSALTFTTAGAIPVVESFETDSVAAKQRLAIKKPSGIQSGDLLLVIVANDNDQDAPQWSNTTNKPTGFTWVSTGSFTGYNNTQSHCAAFWRVADGTESYDSVIVNSVATGNDQVGYFLRISGAHPSTPIDVIGTPMDSIFYEERDTLQCHSITTGYDNELAIVVASFDEAGNSAVENTFTVTGTGWSKLANNDQHLTPEGCDLVIGTKEVPSAGATGKATVDATLVSGACGFQFTIRSE